MNISKRIVWGERNSILPRMRAAGLHSLRLSFIKVLHIALFKLFNFPRFWMLVGKCSFKHGLFVFNVRYVPVPDWLVE